MKIIWSPLALEKLSEISTFIALDKPNVAIEWVDSIFSKVENLSLFPNSGRKVPEFGNEQYRELIIGTEGYRVIYKTTKTQIQILTIRNFKQLFTYEDLI